MRRSRAFGGYRRGFVNSGGATNLTSKQAGDSRSDEVVAVLTGLAAMFLPISALRQLSLVEFSGGRGFLLVTDLDAIFLDVTLFAGAWVLVSSRKPPREHLHSLCFAFGLEPISYGTCSRSARGSSSGNRNRWPWWS
jgi:hypothetical protein